jgi:pyridoxamine 5'-phosphate oxidase
VNITPRDDPFELFNDWFNKARKNKKIEDATAMSLATATKEGMPSVRMVLLKKMDERGFIFYTNLESRKSKELFENPWASVCFYWPPLGRQIRITGGVEQVADSVADEYFAVRPRQSQIGAWASQQSRLMKSPSELVKNVAKMALKFPLKKIPRPPFWSGFRIIPYSFEFWQDKAFRLHERVLYTKEKDSWKRVWLFP